VNGTCAPALSGCVTEAAGFDSCAAYCQSMGEQCVAGGCATIGSPSAITWGAWDDVSLDLCLSRLAPSDTSADSCDETLDVWDDAHRFRSCCCTDG
jgi:hypothetical protein